MRNKTVVGKDDRSWDSVYFPGFRIQLSIKNGLGIEELGVRLISVRKHYEK